MNESTNLTPSVSEPVPEGTRPSSWALLVRMFTGPKAAFESLASKPSFLLPFILAIVVHMGLAMWVSTTDVAREAAIAQMEAQNAPQEQIEATERLLDTPAIKAVNTVSAGVIFVFFLLVSAALLYFMGNLMLGAKLTFRHYLSAATFASIVGLVDSVIRTALIVTRGDAHVRLGLGAFFGEATGFPVAFVDMLTGPLNLWAVAVQAVGVGVFARKGFAFGALASVPGLLLLSVLGGFAG